MAPSHGHILIALALNNLERYVKLACQIRSFHRSEPGVQLDGLLENRGAICLQGFPHAGLAVVGADAIGVVGGFGRGRPVRVLRFCGGVLDYCA